jgi:hypothetical protein
MMVRSNFPMRGHEEVMTYELYKLPRFFVISVYMLWLAIRYSW